MVAPHLIISAAIGRAQVEAFILGGVRRDTENRADKATRTAHLRPQRRQFRLSTQFQSHRPKIRPYST
jgi:hypothetical protein